MGYILLWIEALTCLLLLLALAVAGAARIESRLVRGALIALALAALVFFGSMPALISGALEFNRRLHTGWFWPTAALSLAFLAGASVIIVVGLRRTRTGDPTGASYGSGSARPAAAAWSPGKLFLALVAAMVLHAMTFLNLDAAVKDRLALVRAEAGTLALSVAPLRVPDNENAVPVYRQVFEGFGEPGMFNVNSPKIWNDATDALDPDEPTDFDFASPALGEFLRGRMGQLYLLHEAANRPGCHFDRDYGRPSFDMLLPEMQHLREAARLLAVHARWAASTGDPAAAMRDISDLYSVARHAGTEPLLISMLVSAAIDQMASNTLQGVLKSTHLTSEQLAPLRIDPTVSYATLLDRALRMEEATMLLVWGGFDAAEVNKIGDAIESPELASPAGSAFYRVFLLGDDLNSFRTFMRAHRQVASKGYLATRKSFRAADEQLQNERSGILTMMLVPALGASVEAAARCDARRRVAQVGAAMHRYHVLHGRFPKSLTELAPSDALPLLPVDPYDNKPIKLVNREHGWVVYSVGPDEVDNGGGPMVWSDQKGDLTFEFTESSASAPQKDETRPTGDNAPEGKAE